MSEQNKNESRTIILMDEIRLESVVPIVKQIIAINEHDNKMDLTNKNYERKPIDFYLYTNGGAMRTGNMLIDAIMSSKTHIHIHAMGIIASMGVPIIVSAHKRIGYRRTRFMYHGATSGDWGTLPQKEINLDESKVLQKMMDDLIIEKTHIVDEQLAKYRETSKDWYFGAEEALKLGVIDEIR